MDNSTHTTILPQIKETSPNSEYSRFGRIHFGYQRANDARNQKSPGQDFLGFDHDEFGIYFVVCDGVSKSFLGELAANFLGGKLLRWLQEIKQTATSAQQVLGDLKTQLQKWVPEANELVENYQFDHSFSNYVRTALERQKIGGSQTKFVCGWLNKTGVHLLWMGDSRFQVWDASGHILTNENWFTTNEGWSSKSGMLNGNPHFYDIELSRIKQFSVFTDGVLKFENDLYPADNGRLELLFHKLQEQSQNDDVCVLSILPSENIKLGSQLTRVQSIEQEKFFLKWTHAEPNLVNFYRVNLFFPDGWLSYICSEAKLTLSLNAQFAMIQAVSDKQPASEWMKIQLKGLGALSNIFPSQDSVPQDRTIVSEPILSTQAEPVLTGKGTLSGTPAPYVSTASSGTSSNFPPSNIPVSKTGLPIPKSPSIKSNPVRSERKQNTDNTNTIKIILSAMLIMLLLVVVAGSSWLLNTSKKNHDQTAQTQTSIAHINIRLTDEASATSAQETKNRLLINDSTETATLLSPTSTETPSPVSIITQSPTSSTSETPTPESSTTHVPTATPVAGLIDFRLKSVAEENGGAEGLNTEIDRSFFYDIKLGEKYCVSFFWEFSKPEEIKELTLHYEDYKPGTDFSEDNSANWKTAKFKEEAKYFWYCIDKSSKFPLHFFLSWKLSGTDSKEGNDLASLDKTYYSPIEKSSKVRGLNFISIIIDIIEN